MGGCEGDAAAAAGSRVYWRCRRGMREIEELLLAFIAAHYEALGEEERGAFDRLLDYPDQVLFQYTLGEAVPRDRTLAALVFKIRRSAAP